MRGLCAWVTVRWCGGGGAQEERSLAVVEAVMRMRRGGGLARAVLYDMLDEPGENLKNCVKDADGQVAWWLTDWGGTGSFRVVCGERGFEMRCQEQINLQNISTNSD